VIVRPVAYCHIVRFFPLEWTIVEESARSVRLSVEAEIAPSNKLEEQPNEALMLAINHIRVGQYGIAAIVLHGALIAQMSAEESRQAEQKQMAPETS
jgi:hypothetical protein